MRKRNCKRRRRGRTLGEYPRGSRVRIEDISCCPKERCRLLAMGLVPGTPAEISSSSCGSCCLRVRDADIILGTELAETITACPLNEEDSKVA